MHFSEILPQILVWGLIALLWMECVPAAPCELAEGNPSAIRR
jgi:hypothetical protein